jgi:hypothetical protein
MRADNFSMIFSCLDTRADYLLLNDTAVLLRPLYDHLLPLCWWSVATLHGVIYLIEIASKTMLGYKANAGKSHPPFLSFTCHQSSDEPMDPSLKRQFALETLRQVLEKRRPTGRLGGEGADEGAEISMLAHELERIVRILRDTPTTAPTPDEVLANLHRRGIDPSLVLSLKKREEYQKYIDEADSDAPGKASGTWSLDMFFKQLEFLDAQVPPVVSIR